MIDYSNLKFEPNESQRDLKVEYVWSIESVPENKYSLLHTSYKSNLPKLSHWVLGLRTDYAYEMEIEEEECWFQGHYLTNENFPLTFFYTGQKKPTKKNLNQAIHTELTALSTAFKDLLLRYGNSLPLGIEIDHEKTLDFVTALGLDYESNTRSFIQDFNFWQHRIYADFQWLYYLMGALEWKGGVVCSKKQIKELYFPYLQI